jgi:hypothetical protein
MHMASASFDVSLYGFADHPHLSLRKILFAILVVPLVLEMLKLLLAMHVDDSRCWRPAARQLPTNRKRTQGFPSGLFSLSFALPKPPWRVSLCGPLRPSVIQLGVGFLQILVGLFQPLRGARPCPSAERGTRQGQRVTMQSIVQVALAYIVLSRHNPNLPLASGGACYRPDSSGQAARVLPFPGRRDWRSYGPSRD